MPKSSRIMSLSSQMERASWTALSEEAGRLAAYYSKAAELKRQRLIILKKHVKKPAGGRPGFVIYHTNYSLIIDSDISGIEEVKEKRSDKGGNLEAINGMRDFLLCFSSIIPPTKPETCGQIIRAAFPSPADSR